MVPISHLIRLWLRSHLWRSAIKGLSSKPPGVRHMAFACVFLENGRKSHVQGDYREPSLGKPQSQGPFSSPLFRKKIIYYVSFLEVWTLFLTWIWRLMLHFSLKYYNGSRALCIVLISILESTFRTSPSIQAWIIWIQVLVCTGLIFIHLAKRY